MAARIRPSPAGAKHSGERNRTLVEARAEHFTTLQTGHDKSVLRKIQRNGASGEMRGCQNTGHHLRNTHLGTVRQIRLPAQSPVNWITGWRIWLVRYT